MSFSKKSTGSRSGSRTKYAGIPKSHVGSRVLTSASKKSPSVSIDRSQKIHQVSLF